MDDRELVAQEIVKRLFVDLRDRKLLKWFFPTADEYDPDFFIGDITVKPITPEVQEEIAAAWRQIVLAALAKAGRLASEVGGDVVEAAKIAGTAALVRGGYGDVAGTAARVVIEAASGILAADAERRVRAEIENIVSDAILQSQALGRSELELRLDAITAIRNGVPHA